MKNADKPAFPARSDGMYYLGLTKYEEFVRTAMQGMLSAGKNNSLDNMNIPKLIERARQIADAMLEGEK